MNRLQNIVESDPANPSFLTPLVSNMTNGAVGEVTPLTEGTTVETREYNTVGQMTRILASTSGSTVMDLRHDFAARADNGRIYQMRNIVSGETISYTYESLERRTAANSSLGAGQGQSYGYGGFGNLTQGGAVDWRGPGDHRIPSSSAVGYESEFTEFVKAVGNELGVSDLTSGVYTALVLLHEFKHVLGAPQERNLLAYNKPTFENCIRLRR
jgi:hypothetical protein